MPSGRTPGQSVPCSAGWLSVCRRVVGGGAPPSNSKDNLLSLPDAACLGKVALRLPQKFEYVSSVLFVLDSRNFSPPEESNFVVCVLRMIVATVVRNAEYQPAASFIRNRIATYIRRQCEKTIFVYPLSAGWLRWTHRSGERSGLGSNRGDNTFSVRGSRPNRSRR